jgi:hypothetical protein
VVEPHTLKVYGHLIAADALGDGYIIPLLDTFASIREKTQAETVSLATSLDVAAVLGERLVPKMPHLRRSSSDEMLSDSATGDLRYQKDLEDFHDSGFGSAVPSPVARMDRVSGLSVGLSPGSMMRETHRDSDSGADRRHSRGGPARSRLLSSRPLGEGAAGRTNKKRARGKELAARLMDCNIM